MPTIDKVDRSHAIVVGFDDSAGSRRAVLWAAGEARARNRPLAIVHSVDDNTAMAAYGWNPTTQLSDLRLESAVKQPLDSISADVRSAIPDLPVVGLLPVDDPVTAITGLATEVDAEFVVVGASGRGAIP